MGICDSRRMAATVARSFGRRRAGFQPALGSELIHQPVRQRIAERHAQFQDGHARLIERECQLTRGFEIRIARADVNNEAFLVCLFQVRKLLDDSIHEQELFRCGWSVASLEFRLCQNPIKAHFK